MTRGERTDQSPVRCDHRQWTDRECPLRQAGVRNGQAGRVEPTAAPCEQVEIQHARAPAATGAAAEGALDGFHLAEHCQRIQPAFDERDGIGEIAPGTTQSGIEQDGRGIEQPEIRVEARDRRRDHARGAAVATVGSV